MTSSLLTARRIARREEGDCNGASLSAGHKHLYVHPAKAARRSLAPIPQAPPREAALSVITYGELLHGAAKSEQLVEALERLRQLVHVLPALSLPESAAEAYGSIRAELEARGEVIGNNDLWIAAHAVAAELTLVTNSESPFRRVRGLKIQNWTV